MPDRPALFLPDDRYFGPDPRQKEIARHLYSQVANLPLICPHGHVDPRLFADLDYSFGTPTELLLTPDHYVFRLLYSQGIPLEKLGIPRRDSQTSQVSQTSEVFSASKPAVRNGRLPARNLLEAGSPYRSP